MKRCRAASRDADAIKQERVWPEAALESSLEGRSAAAVNHGADTQAFSGAMIQPNTVELNNSKAFIAWATQ